MYDMFSYMKKMPFDDNLGYTLPFSIDSVSDLGCGKVEVAEMSPTGDILDVHDLDFDELGKISAHFKIKAKVKMPKLSPKGKASFNKLVKSLGKIKSIRKAKRMSAKRPSTKVIAIHKDSIVGRALFAGTNAHLKTIAGLLKKQALKKAVTNEHKKRVKRGNFEGSVLSRLSSIESKLAIKDKLHSATRAACGMP